MSPSTQILIGVVISAMGALFSAWGALRSSDLRANFEAQLKEKSEQIASLSQEALKSITGGDSFCYIEISDLNFEKHPDRGNLSFVHHGKYPIYELNVRIMDLRIFKELSQRKEKMGEAFIGSSSTMSIGTLPPNSVFVKKPLGSMPNVDLSGNESYDFNIFFSSRNGFFEQLLRLRKISGKWIEAIIVTREGKELYRKIPDDFPRNASGEVEW